MSNYVFQYGAFLFSEGPVAVFLMLIVAPAGLVYVVILVHKSSVQAVLGYLIITVPLYAFLIYISYKP